MLYRACFFGMIIIRRPRSYIFYKTYETSDFFERSGNKRRGARIY